MALALRAVHLTKRLLCVAAVLLKRFFETKFALLVTVIVVPQLGDDKKVASAGTGILQEPLHTFTNILLVPAANQGSLSYTLSKVATLAKRTSIIAFCIDTNI